MSAGRERWALRVVVLLSGTATMALQMAAVRLLAPWVGASSLVWATIIGLALLAMSVGYALGGRLADRLADARTLARTLLAAALLVSAIPLVAPLLLPRVAVDLDSAAWSDVVGSGAGFLLLVFGPALLLGVTPPYAIRLAMARVGDAGRTAGALYALSTVGSIVGTLLAALVLVQWIGTRATLWSIAATLVVAAVAARSVRACRPPVAAREAARPAASGVIGIGLASIIVLVEGMAMMGTEMSIARLVAPFFGASHAVWAVIIATVMGSIAAGSRLGGRAADRWPTLGALVLVLAAAASAVALLPFVATPVMRLSTGGIDDVAVAQVIGSFLATMALLVVPVTLLGAVPPWVLRVAVPDVAHAGRTAGRLYALSTIGALIGTFGTVLWLIPTIGTRRTMLLFATALAALAIWLWLRRLGGIRRAARTYWAVPAAGVLIAALALAPTGLVKPLDDGRVLEEEESRYQFIQVVEEPVERRRLLQLNEGWAVHSIWHPDTVLTGGIWDHFLVLPALLERPQEPEMLVIGSAAGTTRRAFAELRPDVQMTSVELDAEVTRIGRRWFELEGEVTAADGRPFLARTQREWDIIHVDAYRQPYIPFYLTTREFFELARSRLSDGGVMSINVGSTPDDPRINEAVAATMRDVFPFVARYRAETYNEVIVAVDAPGMNMQRLQALLARDPLAREGRAELAPLFSDFAAGMREVEPDPDRVLTDDRAPVEWMTDRMIFGAADAG